MSTVRIKGEFEWGFRVFFVSQLFKISTTDFSARRQPITCEKLAIGVAKIVKKFLEVRLWPANPLALTSDVSNPEGERESPLKLPLAGHTTERRVPDSFGPGFYRFVAT